jgi:mono/diheme cytochrome c family protein
VRRFGGLVLLAGAGFLALATGCARKPRFTAPMKLGGVEVAAATLNEGYAGYMQYCYACHGEKGDGRGPAAAAMRPPPRDFSTPAVVFKFAGVSAGELPRDEDLVALIRRGLAGTPMLPWDITDRERHAIVQYIKTFSPRWLTEAPGEPVKPDESDPWQGREAEAIATGEKIYHLAGVEMDPATKQPKTVLAGCNACHPNYLPAKELDALSQRVLQKPAVAREKPGRPALKESEFLIGETKIGFLPTDFLFHTIKNGTSAEALFRTIAAGVGGTAMPTWKGSLKDADLWAVVHYVQHIASLRDTPAATALRTKLAAQ